MAGSTLIRSLALGSLGLAASSAVAQDYYCWKDDKGETVCGDTIPPDQARFDREVRNEQGITVGFEEGEITPEEQEAILARIHAEEEAKREEEERQRYDRMLLDSYEDEADIEARRDRFIEQYDGEIIVTELYIGNLNRKRESLFGTAARYAPISDREDAPPLPENLRLDMQRTESSIARFTQRLAEIQANQEETREQFEKEILRFRELKGSGN